MCEAVVSQAARSQLLRIWRIAGAAKCTGRAEAGTVNQPTSPSPSAMVEFVFLAITGRKRATHVLLCALSWLIVWRNPDNQERRQSL